MGTKSDVPEMVNAFAENLRACRKRLGITQEEFAEVSGLSTNYIARLEVGLSTPSFTTLAKLAVVLQVSASDLLDTDFQPPALAPSDLSTTVAGLLAPLSDEEVDYVLSQLRNSVRFVLSHRQKT